MRLGLCCINSELRARGIFAGRTCTRKLFTVENAKAKALANCQDLLTILQANTKLGISVFRLGSDLFPHYTDKATESYSMDFAVEALAAAGKYAAETKQRVLMHPDQFNQIGAKDLNIWWNTNEALMMHARTLEYMDVPCNEGVLIVHGGGTYGDKESTMRRWIEQFDDLPRCVKRRIAIENCERQYSITDVLEIATECKIPVIFDYHHHRCHCLLKNKKAHCDDELLTDILPQVVETWRGTRPVMHMSESIPDHKNICAHSDYVESIPQCLFDISDSCGGIDLEIEAKAKEKAILKLYKKYPQLVSE
jgi:UV DNA damage endonuclease